MPEKKPNQLARVAAVTGVILMFLLAIVVISTAVGGSSSDKSGSDSGSQTATAADTKNPRIAKALETGIYVVQPGDTLTSISDATGIDVDTISMLNPTLDPQVLVAGTHLKLKQ